MIVKKVPNISHIPKNSDELTKLLLFLDTSKTIKDLCDFIRISILQKSNLSFFETKRKDSTERKWINHMAQINIIEKSQDKGKVELSIISKDFVSKKFNLREYILNTAKSNHEFSTIINDLVDLSYLSNEYSSIPELYSKMQAEFGYIDRPVSAVRNLTGMLRFLEIGNIILKRHTLILKDEIFFQPSSYEDYKKVVYDFIYNNSKYASYASIKELITFMQLSLPEWNSKKIELFIKRLIMVEKNLSFQEASSNKEVGITFKKKNILFIRIKENE